MKISERMTREVQLVTQAQPISDAARLMAQLDVGALPVAESDRLIGMITDRDIVVRAVAAGYGPDTPVRDAMSPDILYCYDDQTVEEVASNMADVRVRRLPVVNRDKRLVGIISDRDLRALWDPALDVQVRDGRVYDRRVSDFMSADPLTVDSEDDIDEVIDLLIEHRVGAIPVVNAEGLLVGIVSYIDVLRAARGQLD